MTPSQERNRMVRQLIKAEAQGAVGNAAATILRAKLQAHERRQDRISVRPDGLHVNESAMERFLINPGDVVRAVYVKGGIPRTTGYDPIGSGLVSDGSGIPGPVAYITDDTSTTDAIRDAIGRDYLGAQSQSVRASAAFAPVDTNTLADNIRAGSYFWAMADGQPAWRWYAGLAVEVAVLLGLFAVVIVTAGLVA